jgi:hypothetical protein
MLGVLDLSFKDAELASYTAYKILPKSPIGHYNSDGFFPVIFFIALLRWKGEENPVRQATSARV